MPFDIFISYSRRDNADGRITQLVERIKTDFAPFAKRELVPFFDRQEIHGMSDWRQRILQGLRESRLLLACLSPAYLQSEYCEWEFVEYLKYEIGHLHGFNGVAPIYFVEVPGWDDKDFEQQCAAWVAELRKRQHFDLRPWHDQGEEALREAAVQERLCKLNRQIVQTITRGERAERSLGNMDAHNPHFIGRTANLRMLRENFVKPGHIGVVTAVNGVGGLGKTALAIEYAHAFADEYGGGRWQVRCAGKDDLRLALAELATPIGFEFTDDEKKNADLQFERTRRELKKLADSAPFGVPPSGGPAGESISSANQNPELPKGGTPNRCLLILDNVDRPGLLDPAQVARLNGGDWLHVLATTRLGENELHGAHRDRSFLAIDELPPDDALALIESYQPDRRFPSEADRDAAREIVRLLGCFTLAVESAAVYLGQFANDVTCAAFLARLKKEGLEGLDTAASQSSEGVLHGEKRLSATLLPTLERLGASEKLALEFATLFPPDRVPLPWLRALVAKTFPAMERDAEPGYPDPWKNVVRRLFSLRLIQATAETGADAQPRVVRIHRLVQDVTLTTFRNEELAARWNAIIDLISRSSFGRQRMTEGGPGSWRADFRSIVKHMGESQASRGFLVSLAMSLPIDDSTRPLLHDVSSAMTQSPALSLSMLRTCAEEFPDSFQCIIPLAALSEAIYRGVFTRGEFQPDQLLPPLLRLLGSRNKYVRWQAVHEFWRICPGANAAPLLCIARSISEHPLVRAEAARQLGRSGDGSLVTDLLDIARVEEFPLNAMAARSASRLEASECKTRPELLSEWLQPLTLPLDAEGLFANLPRNVELSRKSYFNPGRPVFLHIVGNVFVSMEVRWKEVELMQFFMRSFPCHLVCVESGWGNVSLSALKQLGSEERVEDVSVEYFNRFAISADEYFQLASGFQFEIWGVEEENEIMAIINEKWRGNDARELVAAPRRAEHLWSNALRQHEAHASLATILITSDLPAVHIEALGRHVAADGRLSYVRCNLPHWFVGDLFINDVNYLHALKGAH